MYKVIGFKPESWQPWYDGSKWESQYVDEDFDNLAKAREFLASLKLRPLEKHERGFKTLYLVEQFVDISDLEQETLRVLEARERARLEALKVEAEKEKARAAARAEKTRLDELAQLAALKRKYES